MLTHEQNSVHSKKEKAAVWIDKNIQIFTGQEELTYLVDNLIAMYLQT
jgi:hypothetical protein